MVASMQTLNNHLWVQVLLRPWPEQPKWLPQPCENLNIEIYSVIYVCIQIQQLLNLLLNSKDQNYSEINQRMYTPFKISSRGGEP